VPERRIAYEVYFSTPAHCRSGLFHYPHEVPGHVYGSLSTPIAIDALIEGFEGFPLKFEPGTQYGYSNAGYSMLARVGEELGQRLPIGSAQECAEKLAVYHNTGVQRVYLWPIADELEQIKIFMGQVVPLIDGKIKT